MMIRGTVTDNHEVLADIKRLFAGRTQPVGPEPSGIK
jgi:hypothetical protein